MPADSLSDIAIVIVNWRRPGDTIQCVLSLLSDGVKPEQIILIDNGSGDDSRDLIIRACPGLCFYSLPENLGFAGGYNFGIARALETSARRVLLLNNDTVVQTGAIKVLAESDWDVGVPKILYFHHPERIWAAGAHWRSFPPMVVIRGYRQKDSARYDKPVTLLYATGCVLMVRKKVLEAVGGFDPTFENYNEDYDFCFRVVKEGFKIGYVPESRVLHKISQSLGITSPRFWHYLGRNTVLFYRKDHRFSVMGLWIVLVWMMLREIIKLNFHFVPAFWGGVKDGFQELVMSR